MALSLLVTGSAYSQQQNFSTVEAAKNGWFAEQNRSATWYLAQHKKLSAAINALQPQRPGIVDAYVVSIGLYSDAVFARESAEAAKILERRYGAAGRTMYLAAGADDKAKGAPQGSPSNLATALAAIADKMDTKEDVLILFATSHGDPVSGLAYRDRENAAGMIAPQRLADLLDGIGVKRRMVLLSACYSGIFIPLLTMRTFWMLGTHSTMVRAISTSSGLGIPKLTPRSAVVAIASRTTLGACPRIAGPQVPTKST